MKKIREWDDYFARPKSFMAMISLPGGYYNPK
jgi:hypothetical protein